MPRPRQAAIAGQGATEMVQGSCRPAPIVNRGCRRWRRGAGLVRTPPRPTGAFQWQETPSGLVLRCTALEAVAHHAFTSRQLQLRGDRPDGWARATATVDCGVDRLRRVRQVHGAAVRVVANAAGADEPRPEGDALVTATPGVALAVVTADCVPILLADPATGAVAAVHAGWRGTAADVAGAAIGALVREFGVDPIRLVAAIGPSIGACCYEVGDELLAAFTAAGHADEATRRWFARDDQGRLRLDLWTANHDLLVRAGLRGDHVHVAGLCTKTHLDWFESYRAEGPGAGRLAGIIVAPPAAAG
jgi:YfiH family protein